MKTNTNIKAVNKADYRIRVMANDEVYQIMGINGDVVYGGDSATSDHYDRELVEDIFKKWDGTLVCENPQDESPEWRIDTDVL